MTVQIYLEVEGENLERDEPQQITCSLRVQEPLCPGLPLKGHHRLHMQRHQVSSDITAFSETVRVEGGKALRSAKPRRDDSSTIYSTKWQTTVPRWTERTMWNQ